MNTGVYTITNIIDGKIYVGGTINSFKKRKEAHFRQLKNNEHSNKHLQNAWNKYGAENFIFEVLEETIKEYAYSQEQYWINMLDVCNNKYGYNIDSVPIYIKGYIKSKESVKKTADKIRGRKATDTTKQKMSESQKKRNANITVYSEKCINTARKMGIANKGRIVSEETRQKISIKSKEARKKNPASPMLGKKHSEETKMKMRLTRNSYKLIQ